MPGPLRSRGYVERANYITGAALTVNGLTAFSKEFPMGEGWWTLWLRFNHVVTIGTGAGAIAEGELLVIKNVQVRTDRGELICNLPGRALYKIATYKYYTPPRKDAVAASSSTFRVTLPIMLADTDLLRPIDTMLNTARYNSISMQIQYGGVADFYTTVGTSSVAPTLDVEIERTYNALPPDQVMIGHTSYDYRQPVDASAVTAIDLERSADMSIKRLYVHSSTAGTAGVPFSGVNADTIQNVVQLKDQSRFIEKDRIHAMIQDLNFADRALVNTIAGVEVFDYVSKDRSITAALATAGKSVLQYTWTNQAGVAALSIVTVAAEMIRSLK